MRPVSLIECRPMFHFLHHPLHLPLHLFHLPLSRSLCHFPLLFSFLVGLMAIFRNPITLMFGLVQLVAEEASGRGGGGGGGGGGGAPPVVMGCTGSSQ